MKRFGRPLETLEIVFLAGLAGLAGNFAGPYVSQLWRGEAPEVLASPVVAEPTPLSATPAPVVPTLPARENVVQVALVLDVSGSMDGLIAQARSQIWQTVSNMAKLRRDGRGIKLELALFAYGLDGEAQRGHLALLQPLTSDIDAIGQRLFALETSGSDEFAGMVLQRALDDLKWSDDPEALKMVYLAGNESLQQGPVDIMATLDHARTRGVAVNLIYCGQESDGDVVGWRQAALRMKSTLATINHNAAVVEESSPFDQDIAQVGAAINDTYVGRGSVGMANKARQAELDGLSAAQGAKIKRLVAKGSKLYKADWDLVEQVNDNPAALAGVAADELPSELQNLDKEGLKNVLAEKSKARSELQNKLQDLNSKREAYLANERAAKPQGESADLSAPLDASLLKNATDKGYERQ